MNQIAKEKQHNKFLGKCKALDFIPNFSKITKVGNLARAICAIFMIEF